MALAFDIVSIILQVLQIVEYIVRIIGFIWPAPEEETT